MKSQTSESNSKNTLQQSCETPCETATAPPDLVTHQFLRLLSGPPPSRSAWSAQVLCSQSCLSLIDSIFCALFRCSRMLSIFTCFFQVYNLRRPDSAPTIFSARHWRISAACIASNLFFVCICSPPSWFKSMLSFTKCLGL